MIKILLKTKKKIAICALVLALMLIALIGVNPQISAMAGLSKQYAASESSLSGDSINEGDFLISGGVKGQDSKAVFDKSCASTAKLIAKTRMNNLHEFGVTQIFDAKVSFKIQEFAEDGKISFLFGLKGLRDGSGSEKTAELVLYKSPTASDKIGIIINEYRTANVATVLYKNDAAASLLYNKNFVVSIMVDVYSKTYATVNGETVLSGKPLSIDPTGYIGIISYGKNVFDVSDMQVVGYKYDTPETIDYLETFENNYNSNVFYSESKASQLSPSYISVKDGKLDFQNTAASYFSTKYVYSNFELEFDLVDLQREAEYDDKGGITALISNWFGIAFGVDAVDLSADATVALSTWLQFDGIPIDNTDHTIRYPSPRYVLWEAAKARQVQGMAADGALDIWNNDIIEDRIINVKFTVIDGIVSLSYKYDGVASYDLPAFTYDMGVTKTGFVRLFSWAPENMSSQGLSHTAITSFAIDNFSIKNKDFESAKKTAPTPGHKANTTESTDDFVYEENSDSKNLLSNKIANGTHVPNDKLSTGAIVGIVVGMGVVCVGIGAAVWFFVIKKRIKKGDRV